MKPGNVDGERLADPAQRMPAAPGTRTPESDDL